jgi:bacterioferritin
MVELGEWLAYLFLDLTWSEGEMADVTALYDEANQLKDEGKLHEAIEKRAIEEMKHAEQLIGRILFLEGKPIVSNLNKINIGATVDAQHKNDHEAEEGAIKAYNDGIRLAVEVGDNGTRDMLEEILEDEEEHIDWIESQLDQIEQMGLQVYLGEQLEE